jgi:hypothetical protein
MIAYSLWTGVFSFINSFTFFCNKFRLVVHKMEVVVKGKETGLKKSSVLFD